MKNTSFQRGSITGVILIVVVVAIALFVGYWWGTNKKGGILETITDISKQFTATSTTENAATSTTSTDTKKDSTTATTKEVTPPQKPTGKLYTDPTGDFTFRYPENYVYEKYPLVPGELGGYAMWFYEKGSENYPADKSFRINKRHLSTYQITIGPEGEIGCVYDSKTNTFKIGSTFSGATECDQVSSKKNNNGEIYFTSSEIDTLGEQAGTIDRKSFISEKKDLVVTIEIERVPSQPPFPTSLKDLIIQSVVFK